MSAVLPRIREQLIGFYPLLLDEGIHTLTIDPYTRFVKMKLIFINLNFVGFHFGESQDAMCYP
jgi:hypothetical protein